MNLDGWINTEDKRPRIGDKCFICINGVVQHEAYEYVESAVCTAYWSRDDVDEFPFVKDGQLWIKVDDISAAVQATKKRDREIKRLRELIAEIKAWDVGLCMNIPHYLRVRMQAELTHNA